MIRGTAEYDPQHELRVWPETGSSNVALLTESVMLFLCGMDFTLTQTTEEIKNLLCLLASDLLFSPLNSQLPGSL